MQNSLPTTLATQVPLLEARAAQALFARYLQPVAAEPDTVRTTEAAEHCGPSGKVDHRSGPVFRGARLRPKRPPQFAANGQD